MNHAMTNFLAHFKPIHTRVWRRVIELGGDILFSGALLPGMRTQYRIGAGIKDFIISPVPVDFSIHYQIKKMYT